MSPVQTVTYVFGLDRKKSGSLSRSRRILTLYSLKYMKNKLIMSFLLEWNTTRVPQKVPQKCP